MSYESRGARALDYDPVAYAGSALRFRGPRQSLEPPFVLCLGGAETFGRFIAQPFPAQLDAQLGLTVVNMGVMNAGLDVMLNDPAIRAARAKATAIILQVPGAQNMSNRFYTVHPRRNDRFLKATTALRTIYPDVDFTEFHFTGHLLNHLSGLSRDRFGVVQAELRTAWRARMERFLTETQVPVHLIWLAQYPPAADMGSGLGDEPRLIDRALLDEVAHRAASLTVATPKAAPLQRQTNGMLFSPSEEAAASALPGPTAHDRATQALIRILN